MLRLSLVLMLIPGRHNRINEKATMIKLIKTNVMSSFISINIEQAHHYEDINKIWGVVSPGGSHGRVKRAGNKEVTILYGTHVTKSAMAGMTFFLIMYMASRGFCICHKAKKRQKKIKLSKRRQRIFSKEAGKSPQRRQRNQLSTVHPSANKSQ